MTKKELEQLIDLKKEIKELEQSILRIQQMYIGDAPVAVDASKKNFPYTQGKAIVHGYDPVLAKKRSEHLCEKKMLLDDRRKKAAKEKKSLRCWWPTTKRSSRRCANVCHLYLGISFPHFPF